MQRPREEPPGKAVEEEAKATREIERLEAEQKKAEKKEGQKK